MQQVMRENTSSELVTWKGVYRDTKWGLKDMGKSRSSRLTVITAKPVYIPLCCSLGNLGNLSFTLKTVLSNSLLSFMGGWLNFLLPNRSNAWDPFLWGWVLEDCAALLSSDQLEQPETQVQDESKTIQMHLQGFDNFCLLPWRWPWQ